MRWISRVALAMTMCLGTGMAWAEMLVLDTDYVGSSFLGFPFPPAVAAYGASGDNLTAPSGLTNAFLQTEGWYDLFGGSDLFVQLDPGYLTLSAPDRGEIRGMFVGEGSAHDFGGTFTLYQGTGAYEGYTGGGTFRIRGKPFWPPTGDIQPATIFIRGQATRAAPIPEPGTATLIGISLPMLALWRRRGR